MTDWRTKLSETWDHQVVNSTLPASGPELKWERYRDGSIYHFPSMHLTKNGKYQAVILSISDYSGELEFSHTGLDSRNMNGPTIGFGTNRKVFKIAAEVNPYLAKLGFPELTEEQLKFAAEPDGMKLPSNGRTWFLPRKAIEQIIQRAKDYVAQGGANETLENLVIYFAASFFAKHMDWLPWITPHRMPDEIKQELLSYLK